MIKSLLVELIGKDNYQNIPICCYTDNKSLVDTINSTKVLTEKRLQVDICIIRGIVEEQEVEQITWCDSRPIHCSLNSTSVIRLVKRNKIGFFQHWNQQDTFCYSLKCLVDQIQVQQPCLVIAPDQMPDHI